MGTKKGHNDFVSLEDLDLDTVLGEDIDMEKVG